jgi:hypothetical protein
VSRRIERAWVSLLKSGLFRRAVDSHAGSWLFRSEAYRNLIVAKNFITTYPASRKRPGIYAKVNTFCLFIGHTKSGGTLLASLLDAHPNMIFADEADALRYVAAGFSQAQIYQILLRGSRREAMKGRVTARRLDPYSLAVPDQWQGRYSQLRVIGDSKAGISTRRLGENPKLLEQLGQVMEGVECKFIQVVRNPYDPIAIMMVRGKRSFENAADYYFTDCDILQNLAKQIGPSRLQVVSYEAFVEQPKISLSEICHFLDVEAGEEYLEACASIIYESPEQSRHLVDWDPSWIELVQHKIHRYDFLQGYMFEDQYPKLSSVRDVV